MRHPVGRLTLVALSFAAPSTALAYDEAVSGDLSNNASAPTPLAFSLGNNTVAGSATTSAPGDTRDFITFTIASGQQLVALRLMSYLDLPSGNPGNTGFHAINAGATSFVPGPATEANFLGGDHVFPVPAGGTDLLPELSDGDTAGTGFSVPLGPGTYSYVIQQTGPQTSGYDLQFVIGAASATAVPASSPSTTVVLAGLLAAVGLVMSRRIRKADPRR